MFVFIFYSSESDRLELPDSAGDNGVAVAVGETGVEVGWSSVVVGKAAPAAHWRAAKDIYIIYYKMLHYIGLNPCYMLSLIWRSNEQMLRILRRNKKFTIKWLL